jgi:glyoxylase-like metal-dependent hydrolase (beta-lactamase superfamily II)
MGDLGSTMRILRPAPGILGFYDGRVEGARAWSDKPNWLDDGAYVLGVCTYAVVSGGDALVYDTHISPAHARIIRETLVRQGVTRIRVVLSHWHRDHIAGNEAFADCEIIAHALTLKALEDNREAIENGDPPIKPLIMPKRTYEGSLRLDVGAIPVELRHADIHSHDGTVLLLPESGLLFAGDTLEDPVTYVAEPDRLAIHLENLRRMAEWPVKRILPDHGDPQVIAAGGYDPGFIDATIRYVEKLLRCRNDPGLASAPLRDWIADDIAAGLVNYFPPYEEVHRRNVEPVLGAST